MKSILDHIMPTEREQEIISQYNRALETISDLAKQRDDLTAALRECVTALESFECETCQGSKVFKFECEACLSGEGKCTCDTRLPEPCPQCMTELRPLYENRDNVISHSRKLLDGGGK